jgi:hypothetical protein
MPSAASVLQSLAGQIAAFAALLLLASGLHKLIRRERTRTALEQFARVPRSVAPLAVAPVAAAELLAGVWILTPAHRAAGGALAALIWGGYLVFMWRAIAQGRGDVECGCAFGAGRHRVGAYQIARNALLTAAAAFVAVVTAATAADSVGAAQMPAALALLALYAALDQTMTLGPLRSGVTS